MRWEKAGEGRERGGGLRRRAAKVSKEVWLLSLGFRRSSRSYFEV